MFQPINKFYVIRVDDLKPISGEQLAETLDPNEVVYLVSPDRKDIILANVRVCVPPKSDERTDHHETVSGNLRDISVTQA